EHARHVVNPLTTLATQIVERINVERAQRGLAPLHLSGRLRAAASFHSYEMARGGFFSHTSLDGTSVSARLARYYRSAGYRRWAAGERRLGAPGPPAPGPAARQGLTSPEHRTILLDSGLREIGISAVHVGAFQGAAATLVTADFGARSH